MLKFGSSEPNMVSPGTAGMNMFFCGAISKKESISLLNIPLDSAIEATMVLTPSMAQLECRQLDHFPCTSALWGIRYGGGNNQLFSDFHETEKASIVSAPGFLH